MSGIRWAVRFGRTGRRGLVRAMALGSLASGAAVGLAAVSAWLIARAGQRPPVLHLMVAIVSVRALGASRGLFRYLERLAGHDTSFRILGELRAETVAQLERILPDHTTGPGSLSGGDLLSRFVGDVDGLQDLWARVVIPTVSTGIVGVAAVALVTALTPVAGLWLALSLVIAGVVAPAFSTRAARGSGRRLAQVRGHYQTELLELLDGATELSVYGALTDRLGRLDRLDRALARDEGRMAGSAGLGSAIAVLAGGLAVIAGLGFGAEAVAGGDLVPIDVAVVALVPLAIHEVLAGLANAAHRLPELEEAAARTRQVFDREPSVAEPVVAAGVPTGPLGVRVRGLSAMWSPGQREVLDGLDLDLPMGSTTLVVGESGVGKSTLAAVLLRFLDPTAGVVQLVGRGESVDMTHLAADDVRRVIGWCAQDAYVFDSTIEANLRLARPDAGPTEIRQAVERVRLADWLDSLPAGLDTMVGEHGRRLSGGQRQRLALARVLLAERQVVVFDEPTEHLDDAVARELAKDLLASTAERTVLVLTHRPELFPEVDRTLRLQNGRLREVAEPLTVVPAY